MARKSLSPIETSKVTGLDSPVDSTDAANKAYVLANSSGGYAYSTKTAAYTASTMDFLFCDTATTGAFTVTLPATPSSGDIVTVHDSESNFAAGVWETTNVRMIGNDE